MEMNNINLSQINNTQMSTPAETPKNDIEFKEDINAELEKPSETAQASTQSKPIKHIISYIGNGKWIDQKGMVWSRNDTSDMEFTDDEYSKRLDIHFMVGYGQMKHLVIGIE